MYFDPESEEEEEEDSAEELESLLSVMVAEWE